MNWNQEAEEIMRDRFGGDALMALATCRGKHTQRADGERHLSGGMLLHQSPTACPEK